MEETTNKNVKIVYMRNNTDINLIFFVEFDQGICNAYQVGP
jgi:hypothetical protein